MADRNTFGPMDVSRGEVCRNPGFEDKFTCPGCYADIERTLGKDDVAFVRCECGAPLRLEIEYEPGAVAIVCDEDEEEENLNVRA